MVQAPLVRDLTSPTGVITAAGLVGLAPSAMAADCDPDQGHCYAFVRTADNSTYTGVNGRIRYSCMGDPKSMITQQLWISTDGSTAWVEVGVYRGVIAGGAGSVSKPTYFWGRKYNADGAGIYQTWTAGRAPGDTNLGVAITRNSGGYTWQVFRGSTVIGSANSPGNSMDWVGGGGESVHRSDNNNGAVSNLQVKRNGSDWIRTLGSKYSWYRTPSVFTVRYDNDFVSFTTPQNSHAGC